MEKSYISVSRLSVANVVAEINRHVEGKNVHGIFFEPTSLVSGVLEIHVDENTQKVIRTERPSKFKQNASSQYYCVYQRHNKFTYKFVRKNEIHLGESFESELEAALAYDQHVYSVDGHALKTNFPENFIKKVVK